MAKTYNKPLIEEFLDRVSFCPFSGCWLWMGSTLPSEYGTFHVPRKRGPAYAHRFSYEHFVGTIPDGLDIDHLCRVRCCVNPQHLEPVTRAENMRRAPFTGTDVMAAMWRAKTHCPMGHPYEGNNLVVESRKTQRVNRICRECRRAKDRRAYARERHSWACAVK